VNGTRLVELRQKVLNKNDLAARALRQRFVDAHVTVISLVSSPGSGKTAFLERVLSTLRPNYRVAALVGDLATENDAIRLARSQVRVKQICTGTICHLDASMVSTAISDWKFEDLDFLFIENVGNLVCPSSYDLGEQARMVLLSVTEGEDKPLKYPTIFNSADIAIITKSDLAEAVEFSWSAAQQNIQSVRPGMLTFRVSAKSGEGMNEVMRWIELLRSLKDKSDEFANGSAEPQPVGHAPQQQ
jgi:hydrogenase nickel incorporation protein HypB